MHVKTQFGQRPFGESTNLLLIAVFVSVAVFSGWRALRKPAEQALEIDPPTFDFGEVSAGQPLTASIHLKNNSEEELTIHKHIAGCSCTGTSLNKSKLAPGDTAVLSAIYTPSGNSPGITTSSIKILWSQDSGAIAKSAVTLRADVKTTLEISPPGGLVFGPEHQPDDNVVTLTSKSPQFRVLSATSSNAAFSAMVESSLTAQYRKSTDGDSGNSTQVRVHFDRSKWVSAPGAPVEAFLTLRTNDEKYQNCTVRLRVTNMQVPADVLSTGSLSL